MTGITKGGSDQGRQATDDGRGRSRGDRGRPRARAAGEQACRTAGAALPFSELSQLGLDGRPLKVQLVDALLEFAALARHRA